MALSVVGSSHSHPQFHKSHLDLPLTVDPQHPTGHVPRIMIFLISLPLTRDQQDREPCLRTENQEVVPGGCRPCPGAQSRSSASEVRPYGAVPGHTQLAQSVQAPQPTASPSSRPEQSPPGLLIEMLVTPSPHVCPVVHSSCSVKMCTVTKIVLQCMDRPPSGSKGRANDNLLQKDLCYT